MFLLDTISKTFNFIASLCDSYRKKKSVVDRVMFTLDSELCATGSKSHPRFDPSTRSQRAWVSMASMRLTFWELTWDVMEPICFFLTLMYFIARYIFFIRTLKEPSFEGFYQTRFSTKQKRLMKLHNFDIERYNQLKAAVSHHYPSKVWSLHCSFIWQFFQVALIWKALINILIIILSLLEFNSADRKSVV